MCARARAWCACMCVCVACVRACVCMYSSCRHHSVEEGTLFMQACDSGTVHRHYMYVRTYVCACIYLYPYHISILYIYVYLSERVLSALLDVPLSKVHTHTHLSFVASKQHLLFEDCVQKICHRLPTHRAPCLSHNQ